MSHSCVICLQNRFFDLTAGKGKCGIAWYVFCLLEGVPICRVGISVFWKNFARQSRSFKFSTLMATVFSYGYATRLTKPI
jgi:hypothetical protein